MARSIFIGGEHGYVLVRQYDDLIETEQARVQHAATTVAKAGMDSARDDDVRVALTMCYELADIATWLEAEEVKDLGPEPVIEIVNALLGDVDPDDVDASADPEAVFDG